MRSLRTIDVRTKARKVFHITVAWVVVSQLLVLYEYTLMIRYGVDATNFKLPLVLFASLLSTTVAGLTGGSLLVVMMERWLRKKPYSLALGYILLSYCLIFLIIGLLGWTIIVFGHHEFTLFSAEFWRSVLHNVFSIIFLKNFLLWLVIVAATLVVLLVNDKYGPGVFRNFLLGRYFHPKREERIFMFLDLRGSTRIAEMLGEAQYFNFLRDLFERATPCILRSHGEIYQYVGDEIVISWPVHRGVENANCIRCFFKVRKCLAKQKNYFLSEYGLVPEFKAGLHYGHVMAGEIGLVKRDIAFSGDVLNTTSRIEGKCNEFGVDILFSKFLLDKLKSLGKLGFKPKKIGEILLRGKENGIVLYTV